VGKDITKHLGTSSVLDVGSGTGDGADALEAQGHTVVTFEPYPPEGEGPDTSTKKGVEGTFDAVVISYVLNVIPQDERDATVRFALKHLRPGGRAYFIVRSRSSVAEAETGQTLSAPHERVYDSGAYQYGFSSNDLLGYLEELSGELDTVETLGIGEVSAVVVKGGERENRAGPRENEATDDFLDVLRAWALGFPRGIYTDEAEDQVRITGAALMRKIAQKVNRQPGDVDRALDLAPRVASWTGPEGSEYPELYRAVEAYDLSDLPDYRTSRGYYSNTQMREQIERAGFIRGFREIVGEAQARWTDSLEATAWNNPNAKSGWDPVSILQASFRSANRVISRLEGKVTRENVFDVIERQIFPTMHGLADCMTMLVQDVDLFDQSREVEEVARDLRVYEILMHPDANFFQLFTLLLEEHHGLEIGDPQADRLGRKRAKIPELSDIYNGRSSVAEALAARRSLYEEREAERAERKAEQDAQAKQAIAQLWDFASWYVGNGWSEDHGPTLSKKLEEYEEYHREDPLIQLQIESASYYNNNRNIAVYLRSKPDGGAREHLFTLIPEYKGQKKHDFWSLILPQIAHLYLEIAAGEGVTTARNTAKARAVERQDKISSGVPVEPIGDLFERVTNLALEYQLSGGRAASEAEEQEPTETGFATQEGQQRFAYLMNVARFALAYSQQHHDLSDASAFERSFDEYFEGRAPEDAADTYRLVTSEYQDGEVRTLQLVLPDQSFISVTVSKGTREQNWAVRELIYAILVAAENIEKVAASRLMEEREFELFMGKKTSRDARQKGIRNAGDFARLTGLEPVTLDPGELYGWNKPKDVDPLDAPEEARPLWPEFQQLIQATEEAGAERQTRGIYLGYVGELWSRGDDSRIDIEFYRSQAEKALQKEEADLSTIERRRDSLAGTPQDVEPVIRDPGWITDYIGSTYQRADRSSGLPRPYQLATTHAKNMVSTALAVLGLKRGDVEIPSHHEEAYKIVDSEYLLFGKTRQIASRQYKVNQGWKNADPEAVAESVTALKKIYQKIEEAARPYLGDHVPTIEEVIRQGERLGATNITWNATWYMTGRKRLPQQPDPPSWAEEDLLPAYVGMEGEGDALQQADRAAQYLAGIRGEFRARSGTRDTQQGRKLVEAFQQVENNLKAARPLDPEQIFDEPPALEWPEVDPSGLRWILTERGTDAALVFILAYEAGTGGEEGRAIALVIDVHEDSGWGRTRVLDTLDSAPTIPQDQIEGLREAIPGFDPRYMRLTISNLASARLPNRTAQMLATRKDAGTLKAEARADREAIDICVTQATDITDQERLNTVFDRFLTYLEQPLRFSSWMDAWGEFAESVLPDLDGISEDRALALEAGYFSSAAELIALDPPADQEPDENLERDQEHEADHEAEQDTENEAHDREKSVQIQGEPSEAKQAIADALAASDRPLVEIMREWTQTGGKVAGFAGDELEGLEAQDLSASQERKRIGNWAEAWRERARVDVGLDAPPYRTPQELKDEINEQYQQGDRGDELPDDIADLVSAFLRAYWSFHTTETGHSYYTPIAERHGQKKSQALSLCQKLASRAFKLKRGDKNASTGKVAETRKRIIETISDFARFTDSFVEGLEAMEETLPEQDGGGFRPGDLPETLEEATAIQREHIAFHLDGEEDALRERFSRYKARFENDGYREDVARSLAAHLMAHTVFHAPDTDVSARLSDLQNSSEVPFPSDTIAEIAGVRVSAMSAIHATDLRAMLDDAQEGDSQGQPDPTTDSEAELDVEEGDQAVPPGEDATPGDFITRDPEHLDLRGTPWSLELLGSEWHILFGDQESPINAQADLGAAIGALNSYRAEVGDTIEQTPPEAQKVEADSEAEPEQSDFLEAYTYTLDDVDTALDWARGEHPRNSEFIEIGQQHVRDFVYVTLLRPLSDQARPIEADLGYSLDNVEVLEETGRSTVFQTEKKIPYPIIERNDLLPVSYRAKERALIDAMLGQDTDTHYFTAPDFDGVIQVRTRDGSAYFSKLITPDDPEGSYLERAGLSDILVSVFSGDRRFEQYMGPLVGADYVELLREEAGKPQEEAPRGEQTTPEAQELRAEAKGVAGWDFGVERYDLSGTPWAIVPDQYTEPGDDPLTTIERDVLDDLNSIQPASTREVVNRVYGNRENLSSNSEEYVEVRDALKAMQERSLVSGFKEGRSYEWGLTGRGQDARATIPEGERDDRPVAWWKVSYDGSTVGGAPVRRDWSDLVSWVEEFREEHGDVPPWTVGVGSAPVEVDTSDLTREGQTVDEALEEMALDEDDAPELSQEALRRFRRLSPEERRKILPRAFGSVRRRLTVLYDEMSSAEKNRHDPDAAQAVLYFVLDQFQNVSSTDDKEWFDLTIEALDALGVRANRPEIVAFAPPFEGQFSYEQIRAGRYRLRRTFWHIEKRDDLDGWITTHEHPSYDYAGDIYPNLKTAKQELRAFLSGPADEHVRIDRDRIVSSWFENAGTEEEPTPEAQEVEAQEVEAQEVEAQRKTVDGIPVPLSASDLSAAREAFTLPATDVGNMMPNVLADRSTAPIWLEIAWAILTLRKMADDFASQIKERDTLDTIGRDWSEDPVSIMGPLSLVQSIKNLKAFAIDRIGTVYDPSALTAEDRRALFTAGVLPQPVADDLDVPAHIATLGLVDEPEALADMRKRYNVDTPEEELGQGVEDTQEGTEGVEVASTIADTNKDIKAFLAENDIVLASGEATTEDGGRVLLDDDRIRDTDHRYYTYLASAQKRIKVTPGFMWSLQAVNLEGEPTPEAQEGEAQAENLPTDEEIEERILQQLDQVGMQGTPSLVDVALSDELTFAVTTDLTSSDPEYQAVLDALDSLEDRGLVEIAFQQEGRATRWEITTEGRTHLEGEPVEAQPEEVDPEEVGPEEAPGDEPPRSASFQVLDVPISDIYTDEARFQPREASYSEKTAEKIAENYDPNLFDPVDLWRDPQDGRLYMLAGHSRLEGMKRRGADTIPAEIKDFDESDAIRYALIENDKGTSLTNRERATVVQRLRESGELDTLKAQRQFAKENYGRNGTVVFDLSWLDPQGKTRSVLATMETTGGQDYKDAETMAQWVGKLMRVHRDDLTRSHENEIFNFLLDNYKTKGRGFSSYLEYREYVENAKSRVSGMGAFGGFDSEKPLNLAQVVPKSRQEERIDQEVREKQQALKEAKSELEEMRTRLASRKAEGEEVTEDDFERILAPYERAVRGAEQRLIEAKREAQGARQQVRESQSDLFAAMRENPDFTPVLLVHIGRVSRLIVDGDDGERISYAAGGKTSFMYMTHEGDALVIVPEKYVTEVPRDEQAEGDAEASDAWEMWHHMKPQGGDHEIEIPLGPGERVGTATRIHYESDKLIEPGDRRGKQNSYFHDFEEGVHSVREYVMPRGALVLTVGGTLGSHDELAMLHSEGRLEVDGRGILN